jgi:formylglycine-generating enzyme required for sulfatase activity
VFDARVIDRILGRAMSEWPQEWTDPTTFRKDIAVHTNLLQPTDVLGLKYRFLHRTFLEFFVAEAISQKSDVIIDEKVKQYRDDPRWAEVFVLLAGMLNKDEARKHLVRLADAAGDYRSLLALRACGEAPEGALTDALADRVLGLEGASWRARRDLILDLARLLEHQNDAVRFFEAFCKTSKTAIRPSDMWSIGEALRRIDSQLARDVERRRFAAFPPVPGRLKELMVRENSDAWCVVEGGSFVFGSEASESDRLGNEPTASLVCVDRCEIGRLVVTADDYAEFEPRYSLRVGTRAGFPAIKVSWFETMCFAEWLNTSQASCEVRLPSEAEWEKAAGFDPATGQKRKYPWGDTWRENHANCGRGANGRPVSADAHPEGDSACGARQMSGNVYEWTLNSFYQPFDHHAQPPEWARQESISTHRTARGGCYGDAPSRCRVTSRQPFDPDERYDYVGFRLVRIRKM